MGDMPRESFWGVFFKDVEERRERERLEIPKTAGRKLADGLIKLFASKERN